MYGTNKKRKLRVNGVKNILGLIDPRSDGVDITVISDREINIDGCTGIEEYSDTEVVFAGKSMKIKVFGDGLELYTYAGGRIKASGRIRRIEYERGDLVD